MRRWLQLLFAKNWLWVGFELLIWICFLGAYLNSLVRLNDCHFLHSFVWKDCVLHHSPGRQAGAVTQNNFFSSPQALRTATLIHVLIFEPNLATTNSSPATFSIEQKFPKPWELKDVHLLEQLSTSKVAEQLQYLDWAQGWLQWGVTVSGL